MAAQPDPNVSDDEHPMPSERSSAPSANVANRDEILMPEAAFRKFLPNNHRLNLDMRLQHPVIMEIIKNHPLRYAFVAEQRVPAFYLQQIWYSMEYFPVEGDPHFTLRIDDYVSRLTPSRLRRVLHLPAHNADPRFTDYEELPTDSEMCDSIRSLGYDESEMQLTSLGQFKRMYLPQIYFTIFSLINRCLTGKATGMDKASTAVMRIFLGFVFNRHFDYALLIWNDLVEYATDRQNNRERDFLPYQRFLQLVVHSLMLRRPDIPRRQGTTKGPTFVQKYLKLNNRQFPFVLPIPESLLSLADQGAQCVIEYRERNGLMAHQPPVVPPHEPARGNTSEEREGPSTLGEQVQVDREPEQGPEREDQVRGIDVGGASGQSARTPTAPIQRPPRFKRTANRPHIRRLPPPSSSETETDEEPLQRRRRTTPASQSESITPEIPAQPQPTSPIPTPPAAVPTPTPEPEAHPPTPEAEMLSPPTVADEPDLADTLSDALSGRFEFDFEEMLAPSDINDIFTEPPSGEIRRAEGVQVENVNVSVGRDAEKVIVSEIPSTTSRVTQTSSSTHPLGGSADQDAVDPPAQTHTPPSHLVTSQQATISQTTVGLAHNLAPFHSETTIESRSSIPPASTSFLSTSSIDPPRAHTESLQTASLRGPVGTPIVMPIPGIPRGLGGSPTSVNITPALSVGHTVYSTVVSTGSLRDPGVSQTGTTASTFTVTADAQAYVDAALQKSKDALADHEQSLRQFGNELITRIIEAVRGPPPATSQAGPSRPGTSRSPPPPPRHPSPSSEDTESVFREPPISPRRMNRDELMSALYADLLSEATARGLPEDDLTGLLRRILTIPTVTRHEFDVFRDNVDQRLSAMEKLHTDQINDVLGAVTALRTEIQQSCRPAASAGPSRRFQDDPDQAPTRPEGETHSRVGRTQRTSTSTAPSTAPPTSSTRRTRAQASEPSGSRVETPMVEKPAEDIPFEHTSAQDSDDERIDVQNLRDSVKDWFKDPYEPVLQEADYVNLRHAEQSLVHPTTSTQNLLPHQIRWQRVLSDSNSKWINPQYRAPYLEETMEKIFRKTLKPEDLAHIHLVMEMDQAHVKEYVSMLKIRAQSPREVESRHRIVDIMQVSTDRIFQVEYPTFKVRRQDGKAYNFSEADFVWLDIIDFETLYTELKEKTRKTREEKIGMRALVRHVQKELRYNYLHDLQRGIESGQKKVHLLKPNQRFPGLDEHPVTTVLTRPAHGVVWMHAKGEKRFLRFDEIAAYSDGTLSGIRHRLNAELSKDKNSEERMDGRRRIALIEAIALIDKRIIFRQTLRRFEGMFELRKKFHPIGGDC